MTNYGKHELQDAPASSMIDYSTFALQNQSLVSSLPDVNPPQRQTTEISLSYTPNIIDSIVVATVPVFLQLPHPMLLAGPLQRHPPVCSNPIGSDP